MLAYYYSRINGKIKIRCTLWSPQLTEADLATELAKIEEGLNHGKI